MNIDVLFSTEERVRILNEVIFRLGPISVNEVAREAHVSKGLVSKYLNQLVKDNILEKKDGKFHVRDNINTKAVKILLNLSRFDTDLFERYDFVKGAGVYGSLVKGSNSEESDIDLWILTEMTSEESLATLTSELRGTFGDVRPLYLTKEKLELLKEADPLFYHSLIFGSITIHGGDLEEV
jgi:predicted nucleotidyltransferase